MRTRGIKDGYAELKARDPNTSLTETALRRLIVSGTLPSFKIGNRYKFDMDILEAYLCGELQQIQREPEPPQFGTIRRVV